MNHNEEVPDFLGGLGDMVPADVLKKVVELLEQLRRADKDHQGSTVFIYAPGSQYVETVQNQYLYPAPRSAEGRLQGKNPAPYRGGESTVGGKPAYNRSGELVVEERIRRCIGLLMAERYGNEPLFNLQGHWQAVYRILVDKGYCRDSDFDGFDAFIRRVMPEEVNKPYKKDSVRNINKTSFNKPFDRWRYDPDDYGTRKPFERMVAIARRFKEILEEIDL
ncbi:MAG: hypothetical protein J6X46_08325 [Prevotella sp.]|nr:hypothetical protein [Prevotella sp.]